MATVIFDIETVGEDFDSLDKTAKDSFLKYAESKEEEELIKESLGLYPLTGQIIAIGILEAETEKGCVYFQNRGDQYEKWVENDITFLSGNEKEILQHFWKQMERFSQFVTFNGRVFDCPYLMIRSAVHQIKPAKNLCTYRYNTSPHVDLADQLSFYDALRRKFSLHMWCRAFSIESPKEEGMDGSRVKENYQKGRYRDIARYCMRDIQATKKLYLHWDKFIKC